MTSYPPKSHHVEAVPERAAAWIAFAGSGLLILFWALYFSGLLEFGSSDGILAEFEAAFPFADAVLASTLLVAGIGLRRGRRYGVFCLTGGASMTLYLGILDLTFYSTQGMYSPLTSDGVVELVVNFICIIGGLVGLGFSWRLWGVAR